MTAGNGARNKKAPQQAEAGRKEQLLPEKGTAPPSMIDARVKDAIFYGAFALLFVLYGVIVGGVYFGWSSASSATMAAIASMAPIILDELSLPGEAGPFVLGAVMAWTAPRRASNWQTVLVLALCALLWLAYLHMQIFFGEPLALLQLEIAGLEGDAVGSAKAALSTFAGTVRTFAAVILSAVLGLKFNDNVPVFKGPSPAGGAGKPGGAPPGGAPTPAAGDSP